MITPDQKSFLPSTEKEKSIVALQTRYDALYTKFGIDPNEEVNHEDDDFMKKAMKGGTKEWIQLKLDTLEDLISDANLGDEEYTQADQALKSWEEYESVAK